MKNKEKRRILEKLKSLDCIKKEDYNKLIELVIEQNEKEILRIKREIKNLHNLKESTFDEDKFLKQLKIITSNS